MIRYRIMVKIINYIYTEHCKAPNDSLRDIINESLIKHNIHISIDQDGEVINHY